MLDSTVIEVTSQPLIHKVMNKQGKKGKGALNSVSGENREPSPSSTKL
jgi:hypothetical protein